MRAATLDPAVIASVDDLEVVARQIVDGARSGMHRSPLRGFSAEFSQHRAYRPGDDLKYLDWKALARTDRLYTREFRETTNLSAVLVLDASASMAFPAEGLSKFRYAVLIAGALAYLITSQGDSVGLLSSTGDTLVYVPPRAGRPHLKTVLTRLARLEPALSWPAARTLARGRDLVAKRGLLFVLSDFYDDEEGVRRELASAARRGHDVTMLQVLSRAEIEFPFRRTVEFEDLESGATLLVDADAARRRYRDGLADFLTRVRARALRDGLDYALLTTDLGPDVALRRYLLRRGSPIVSHADREKA